MATTTAARVAREVSAPTAKVNQSKALGSGRGFIAAEHGARAERPAPLAGAGPRDVLGDSSSRLVCRAVIEIRRITFDGSRPICRALVQMLEEEGVTVQLPGRHTSEYRDAHDMADGVFTTLIAAGTLPAIRAGVRKVRWRFPRAKIEVEGEDD
jgi:hypothetical protein